MTALDFLQAAMAFADQAAAKRCVLADVDVVLSGGKLVGYSGSLADFADMIVVDFPIPCIAIQREGAEASRAAPRAGCGGQKEES